LNTSTLMRPTYFCPNANFFCKHLPKRLLVRPLGEAETQSAFSKNTFFPNCSTSVNFYSATHCPKAPMPVLVNNLLNVIGNRSRCRCLVIEAIIQNCLCPVTEPMCITKLLTFLLLKCYCTYQSIAS
jgi:hypothetical protein